MRTAAIKVPQLANVLRGPLGITSVASQIVPSIASSERDLLHAMVVAVQTLLVGWTWGTSPRRDYGVRKISALNSSVPGGVGVVPSP